MTVHLIAILEDGTELDEFYPNHELGDLEIMVQETEESLFVRVEIEDSQGNLITQYKRKITHAY